MLLAGHESPITTAEDLIVLKMVFHREKDLRDVRGILWVQKGKLDLAYMRQWASRMLEDEVLAELEGWIERFPPETTLFYFFLVSVSDAQGLSFYADATVVRLLNITHEQLSQARARLRDAALILYSDPLYQVLALPEPPVPPKRPQPQPPGQSQSGQPLSLREIFALVQPPAWSTADPSIAGAQPHVERKRP
jgi:hypothetical protein